MKNKDIKKRRVIKTKIRRILLLEAK